MNNCIDTWLAQCPDPADDPLPGMRQAGLLEPVSDYTTLARIKAALVERTGLLGVGSVWSGPQLVFRHFVRTFGSEAQQTAWCGRALSVAISEPKVGAHPKLLTTRANPDPAGDGFRITGQKAWVSNGPSADGIIVFAITSEEMGRKRYSAFLVPRDTPGLGISEMPGFHALRPSRHCLLTVEDCPLPAAAIVGAMGTAYEHMALPFRDVEDAVGTFGLLGAFHYAIGRLAGVTSTGQAAALGAIVALTAVFQAAATSVVAALDDNRLHDGDATLVGLRLLATDLTARLKAQAEALSLETNKELLALTADLEATLSIARGPRLARQARLGETALRPGTQPQ
jgi:acyl-CoA dehydrogenase